MTFSSNEAECIGGREAVAGTEQKSWGLGGGGAYIRDRVGWWRGPCLKIDKEGKRRDRRPGEKLGPACMSLIFQSPM